MLIAPRTVVLWLILSGLVSLAGPFGTFQGMSWPLRVIYWGGLIGASIPVAAAIRIYLTRRMPALAYWQRSALVALGFSALFTPVVYATTDFLAARGLATMVPVVLMWLATFLSSAAVCAVKYLFEPQRGAGLAPVGYPAPPAAGPEAAEPMAGAVASPVLLLRVAAEQRGEVLHLSVDDHYVRVTTVRGHSRLLMRFADAIREMAGVDGLRVHRSHWVAAAAVTGVLRSNGRMQVQLRDGGVVPASRRYRGEVDARWPE